MKNTEQLYNRLFQDIMRHTKDYFGKLSWKAAAVIGTKFVEVVVSSHNTNEVSDEITVKNLSEIELAGMQYLAGYVLRTIYSKLHSEKDAHLP